MGLIGQGSQVVADFVFQFAKVLGSSIAAGAGGTKRPVQYRVVGLPGWDEEQDAVVFDENDNNAETSDEADVFGALGIVSRPLPPVAEGDVEEHAEVVCVRTADGLVPIAVRDVRLRMGGNAPSEGTIAFVGYGGGYHSITPVDNADLKKGAIQVVYCGYDLDDSGIAAKAHSIILDPTAGNESIMIVHAEGMAITMSGQALDAKQSLVLKNKNGDAWIRLDNDGIFLGGKIVLNGSVIVGNPMTSVPLLAGVLSPPCSTLFLSP
jgi:hypothetical protein